MSDLQEIRAFEPIFGSWYIEKLIGKGSYGSVYKASRTEHGNTFYSAIKHISIEDSEDYPAEQVEQALTREININYQLRGESHFVSFEDSTFIDKPDGRGSDAFIRMELLTSLTDQMKLAPLTEDEVIRLGVDICEALEGLEKRNIIHRDIKPANIFVSDTGAYKLGDFGVARSLGGTTGGMTIAGTFNYMAPEIAKGAQVRLNADLYSLGIVMYEMLTAQKPYEGETITEIAVKHINANPVPPHELVPDVPPELERITLKAMCADIDERYQSAEELLEDLELFVQEQLKPAEPEEKPLENPAVVPVRSVSEMDKERFLLRHRRARRVTYLMGSFGALGLCVVMFVFMWNFWLKEVFSPAERISLPNFVGSDYRRVVDNAELASLYSFDIVYVINTETESGTVLSQNPDPGRSMMVTPDGIKVELSVSTGKVFNEVPDVVNLDYREATNRLQKAGFIVDIENAVSASVTKDYVISTSPMAGEQMSSGSTVYVTVSTGPQTSYVRMPNVIGLSEEAAISRLESAGLSYGGSDRVYSDVDAGTVIGQSADAFTEIEEHSKIALRVSLGPQL